MRLPLWLPDVIVWGGIILGGLIVIFGAWA